MNFSFKNKTPQHTVHAGFFFTVLLLASVFHACSSTTTEKKKLASPQVGDVFLVKESVHRSDAYYFLKVSELWEDSIIVLHSSFEYDNSVKQFDKDDFFVLDEQLVYTKDKLQQLFDRNELTKIEREYGSNDGFERAKY